MPTRHPNAAPWTVEAARLREAVDESGLSNQKLAGLAGVTPATIADMLGGKRVPRTDTLIAVCDALGVSISWIKMGREPRRLDSGARNEIAAPKTPSAVHLQPVQLPGLERWLAEQRGVLPDEREWLRTIQWPAGHIRYPDLVYNVMLHTYRQMRDYRPFDAAADDAADPQAATR